MKGMSFFTKRYTEGYLFPSKSGIQKGKAFDLEGRTTLLNSPPEVVYCGKPFIY